MNGNQFEQRNHVRRQIVQPSHEDAEVSEDLKDCVFGERNSRDAAPKTNEPAAAEDGRLQAGVGPASGEVVLFAAGDEWNYARLERYGDAIVCMYGSWDAEDQREYSFFLEFELKAFRRVLEECRTTGYAHITYGNGIFNISTVKGADDLVSMRAAGPVGHNHELSGPMGQASLKELIEACR